MSLTQSDNRPWQTRLPVFYGWVIVAVSWLLLLVGTAPLWTFGVFVQPMQDDLGWTRSALLGGLTLRTVVTALSSPLLGRYFDSRRGLLPLAVISSLVSVASLGAVAFVHEEWQFLLIYGVIGGLSNVPSSGGLVGAMLPKWFLRQRGTAVAISTMGSPAATLALPPFVAFVIFQAGWREAWIALGVLALVLGVLPSLLLIRQPEDIGLHPDGDATAPLEEFARGHATAPGDIPGLPLSQAIRTPVFWLVLGGIAIGSFSIVGLPANLIPMFMDKGLPRDLSVWGFTTYGLLGFGGRIVWGYVINRAGVRAALIGMTAYGALITPLFVVLSGPITVVYAGLIAFGIGSFVSFNQVLWAVYFGRAHLGAITGTARPIISLASAAGPFVLAGLYDSTGAHDLGVWLAALTWLLSMVVLLLVKPPGQPRSGLI